MKNTSLRKKLLLLLLMSLLLVETGCGGGNGDRVLVAKYMYDDSMGPPQRHDVVVFRYPEKPLKDGVPTNYIKRLLGLAGETIAIFFGQLFFFNDPSVLSYPEDEKNVDPLELWRPDYMHFNDSKALELFQQGKFTIIRKPPQVMLAMRRNVYDNDHQAADLKGVLPPRWNPKENSSWNAVNEGKSFNHSGTNKEADWLHYQHIIRPESWPKLEIREFQKKIQDLEGKGDETKIAKLKKEEAAEFKKPRLVTDFLSYNSRDNGGGFLNAGHWVGDLMLEMELKVEKGDGEFWLELARGVDRFQARWDLANGKCKLVRLKDDGKEETLDEKDSAVRGPGTFQIRFANFDERLTVWVNNSLPFGDGVNYSRAWKYDAKEQKWHNSGPTANDLKPASLASKGGAVQVHHLKLWRDTYYTISGKNLPHTDSNVYRETLGDKFQDWGDSSKWGPIGQLPVGTMYVQPKPKHYLCLGDNSPQSSDSREWGTVPERLLLGRALVVYFPFNRIEVIH